MKYLVIIGAGGMGKEINYIAEHSIGYGTEFIVKGFLDDNIHSMDGIEGCPPILDTITNYQPIDNDVFCCSIGNVQMRKKVCELIKSKGGMFQKLIHKDAQIRRNVQIGNGTIVDYNASIGSNAVIGENCLLQIGSVIGHDVKIGDNSRIDCHVVCVGGTEIGNDVCIHTNSVINHGVKIGDGATVGAMSFVIRKVKPNTNVQGNPAKQLDF